MANTPLTLGHRCSTNQANLRFCGLPTMRQQFCDLTILVRRQTSQHILDVGIRMPSFQSAIWISIVWRRSRASSATKNICWCRRCRRTTMARCSRPSCDSACGVNPPQRLKSRAADRFSNPFVQRHHAGILGIGARVVGETESSRYNRLDYRCFTNRKIHQRCGRGSARR